MRNINEMELLSYLDRRHITNRYKIRDRTSINYVNILKSKIKVMCKTNDTKPSNITYFLQQHEPPPESCRMKKEQKHNQVLYRICFEIQPWKTE